MDQWTNMQETEKIADETGAAADELGTATKIKRKKGGIFKKILGFLLCAALLVGIGYAGVRYALPEVRYQIGIYSLENGNPERAVKYFDEVSDYKDAAEYRHIAEQECLYLEAGDLTAEKRYAEALEVYSQIKGFRDVEDLVLEVNYQYAEALAAEGKYTDSLDIYRMLGDYRDAAERITDVNYQYAVALLEEGQHEDARSIFDKLGDYRNSKEMVSEATYRIACEFSVAEDWYAALHELEKISGYRDVDELIVQAELEIEYKRALLQMEAGRYKTAAEGFRALGDFRDAKQKIDECLHLAEVDKIYTSAMGMYRQLKWGEAYREFSKIVGENYKNADQTLKAIRDRSEGYVREYANSDEQAIAVVFLRVLEEIDEQLAAQLREELLPNETMQLDYSYYDIDPPKATSFSSKTSVEDLATIMLYMSRNFKTELTLYSQEYTNSDTMEQRIQNAFYLATEIDPGMMSVYNWGHSCDSNQITIYLNYGSNRTVSQRRKSIEIYEEFCEDSLQSLIEAGLIRSSMSRKERARIICDWVAFYLDYDTNVEIYDAGIAVQGGRGVCLAQTAVYNRMCNLAGIPTYGQIGQGDENYHIWSIHLDENGNIFYVDSTTMDNSYLGEEVEERSMEAFIEMTRERMKKRAVAVEEGTIDVGLNWHKIMYDAYFWEKKYHGNYSYDRTAEEIIAFHQKLMS